jgi:hypothetical protein
MRAPGFATVPKVTSKIPVEHVFPGSDIACDVVEVGVGGDPNGYTGCNRSHGRAMHLRFTSVGRDAFGTPECVDFFVKPQPASILSVIHQQRQVNDADAHALAGDA